jgi:hypothetical protein
MRNNYTSTITNYNEKYSNFFSHVKEAVFEKKYVVQLKCMSPIVSSHIINWIAPN